jgi:hypothetical protein
MSLTLCNPRLFSREIAFWARAGAEIDTNIADAAITSRKEFHMVHGVGSLSIANIASCRSVLSPFFYAVVRPSVSTAAFESSPLGVRLGSRATLK